MTSRERVPAARVDTTMYGTRMGYGVASGPVYGWGDSGVADHSLFVVFRGASAQRGRIIDEFALPDFTYVGTRLAPRDLRAMAGAEDRLTLLMEDTAGYYVATQLRRRGR